MTGWALHARKTDASLDFHELKSRGFVRRLACRARPNALPVPANKLLDEAEALEAVDALRLFPKKGGAGREAPRLLDEADNWLLPIAEV